MIPELHDPKIEDSRSPNSLAALDISSPISLKQTSHKMHITKDSVLRGPHVPSPWRMLLHFQFIGLGKLRFSDVGEYIHEACGFQHRRPN